jgi:ribosomal protein S15P/S13E
MKEEKDSISSVNLSKTREQFSELLDYVREEMRNQYKKLNDHIRLWEQKYDLLKKKIY